MVKYFTAVFLLLNFAAMAQPSSKLIGWYQSVLPGMNPDRNIDENGSGVARVRETPVNYFIYLTHNPVSRIVVDEIWINGKRYRAKLEIVTTTPVDDTNYLLPNQPKITTLVPATTDKVTRIIPGEMLGAVKSSSLKKMVAGANLVISYYWKRKKYYKSLKSLKQLEPLAAM